MSEFIDYWSQSSVAEFVRIFWYFFIIELPRYVLLDYVILVIYWLDRTFNREARMSAEEQLWRERPFVSIIVPGKDEGENYHQIVQTLQEQTYQNFELIIVDDGSEDGSAEIGRYLEKQGLIDLFLSNSERGGKASAANLAMRHANGEYVVHMDADCSFDRDAIEKVLFPFFYEDNVGAVSGNLEVRNNRQSLCTTLQAIEYLKSIFVGRRVTASLDILNIISGAFGAYRRDVIEKIGGWDVGPGEDSDITLKIRKIGYRIAFAPEATALTDVPERFRDLTKQRNRWARSLIRFRLRRHFNFLIPDKNLRLRDVASIGENVIFSLVINILWFVYVTDVIVNYRSDLQMILPMVLLLYTTAKYVEFIPILVLSEERRNKLKYLAYMPMMIFYTGYYRRVVRTRAYIKEWFWKESYWDEFNPKKSSEQVRLLDRQINRYRG